MSTAFEMSVRDRAAELAAELGVEVVEVVEIIRRGEGTGFYAEKSDLVKIDDAFYEKVCPGCRYVSGEGCVPSLGVCGTDYVAIDGDEVVVLAFACASPDF